MPFFVLRLNNNPNCANALKHSLEHSPNGTPLCCAQAIHTPRLSNDTLVYWLNDEHATLERIDKVRLLDGVEMFEELNLSTSIYDPDWKWEDDYIESKIIPILPTETHSSFADEDEYDRGLTYEDYLAHVADEEEYQNYEWHKARGDTVDESVESKVLEEIIVPFIGDYLGHKKFVHEMLFNRDPHHKPKRELRAIGFRKREVIHEYDGLFVIKAATGIYLLNSASQLHLTRRKLQSVKDALITVTLSMIPAWRRDCDEDVPLRYRCPLGIEDVVRQNMRICLLMTYFTVEDDLDLRDEASELMDIEFVQLSLLSMGAKEDNDNLLRAAIDRLIDGEY